MPDDSPRFTEVAPKVWVAHYDWMHVNITLVGGSYGLVMVDTHGSAAQARLVADDVRRLGAGPLTALVNTHEHWDHHFGNATMVEQFGEMPIHATEWARDHIEESARRTFDAVGPAFAALASLAVLVFVATRRPRGPLTDALLVGVLVSLLVNDTPGDVLGMGAVGAFVLWRYDRRTAHDAPAWRDRLRAMRRPAIAPVLAIVALALGVFAAGCSEGEVTATPETVVGTIPEETTGATPDLPALELTGDATAGEAVFESAGCGACHTLSAAGSTGTVGPNLDDAKPSYELVVTRVTLGQGGMPAFQDQLEPQQIADVAEFVSSSAGG